MSNARDTVIERLRGALQGAVQEVRRDPEYAAKIINTICLELGLDSMAALYISARLKTVIQEKAKDVS